MAGSLPPACACKLLAPALYVGEVREGQSQCLLQAGGHAHFSPCNIGVARKPAPSLEGKQSPVFRLPSGLGLHPFWPAALLSLVWFLFLVL